MNKIQAIGPRPVAGDFFVEDAGTPPSARPAPPGPQVLGPTGALSLLPPRRRQPGAQSMAPRKPLDEVQSTFRAKLKEPDKESEAGAASSGRATAGSGRAPAPVRHQRRRVAAHHHEPDHHDTPHPQLNSGSAEALFAANQVQVGRAERVAGLGSAGQMHQHQLPVAEAGESDLARFDRPRDRRNDSLAALQRLLGAQVRGPVQDPLLAHPERYDAAAKAALKERIVEQGPSFRTTPEEREEFRQAYLFQAQADLPARLKPAGATLAHEAYDTLIGHMEQLQRSHPELRHIPTEDLAALRAFTGSHRALVQNALLGDQVPANPLGLSFAKAVVSALHALPPAYTHQGPAFTRMEAADALQPQFKPGQTRVEWQVFAATQALDAASQAGHGVVQTQSLAAKNIAAFSMHPQEQELVFPPGTGFRTERVTSSPSLAVVQSELPHQAPYQAAHHPPLQLPPGLTAALRAAAPAA